MQLIRVTDNGAGIPEDEVEIAFERHATSKIKSEVDIEVISSLGFRGEALPTIASVAEVGMTTRYRDDVAGTAVRLESGIIRNKTKQGCPQGTTITVKNLFQNVPARLKFLKSTPTENSHISHLVSQYCLAFPEVKFALIINGRTGLRSSGNGNLRDALVEVYGLQTGQSMLELATSGDIVSGFISPASVSRSNRNYLSFFVNRRWVQSRMLTYAVEEAYHGMLMTGKHPIVAISISVPSQDIDVNVHPTKREIKFHRERDIFMAVQKAVRETLVVFTPVQGVSLAPQLPGGSLPTQIPFAPSGGETSPLFSDQVIEQRGLETSTGLPILRVIGQLQNTYILAEGPDGVYLIDQHAAHERIVFEKIIEQQARRAVEIQGLLEPLTIEVTAQQEQLLSLHSGLLSEYGFLLDRFGERTYILRSVPALLKRQDIAPVVTEILDSLGGLQETGWQWSIARSLACHAAIRAGQTLSVPESEKLVFQLEQTNSPRTCPHGRPTMIHLSTSQLEREFGRR